MIIREKDLYLYNSDELYHYGVKGMKWGVRRYKRFNGKYTQMGIRQFEKSVAKYDKAKSKYKNNKTSINKTNMELAESRVRKDYKQLKKDKLADQGARLHSKGYRQTNNFGLRNIVYNSAVNATISAGYLYAEDILSENAYETIKSIAGYTSLVTAGFGLVERNKNRKLYEYYTHRA